MNEEEELKEEKRTYYYFSSNALPVHNESLVVFSSTFPEEEVIKFFKHGSFLIPNHTWFDVLYKFYTTVPEANVCFEKYSFKFTGDDAVNLVDEVNKAYPERHYSLWDHFTKNRDKERFGFISSVFLFLLWAFIVLLWDILVFSIIVPLTIIYLSFLMTTVVGALYVIFFHHWVWLFYPLSWLDLTVDPFRVGRDRDATPVQRFMYLLSERN